MKALTLTAGAFEEAERLVPCYRLREEGIAADAAAASRGPVRGEHGYPADANRAFSDVVPLEHDVLLIPGGRAARGRAWRGATAHPGTSPPGQASFVRRPDTPEGALDAARSRV